jgi:hypothetical protein
VAKPSPILQLSGDLKKEKPGIFDKIFHLEKLFFARKTITATNLRKQNP